MPLPKQKLIVLPIALSSGIGKGLVFAIGWWLKSAGFSYSKIAMFSILTLVIAVRFLWIPIFDKIDLRLVLARLNVRIDYPIQRKGFMLITSLLASSFMYLAACVGLKFGITTFAALTSIACFWLANCDSIALAYLHETIQAKDVGGMSTAGYRVGIFSTTVLSLYIYENFGIGWPALFKVYSVVMFLLNLLIIFAPREVPYTAPSFQQAFVLPYKDLIKKYGFSLLVIVLFIILFKISDRFVSPLEAMFLRSNFTSHEFFVLKFLSTFALTFAAVKSDGLLKKVGFKNSFLISIIGNVLLIFSYFLCTLKNVYAYLASALLSCVIFTVFHRFGQAKSKYFSHLALIALGLVVGYYFGLPLHMLAIFAAVIVAKMISGIRASTLYSYEFSLASQKYSLAQITIISCMEQSVNTLFGSSSGHYVDKFGWTGLYLIALGLTFLPLLVWKWIRRD